MTRSKSVRARRRRQLADEDRYRRPSQKQDGRCRGLREVHHQGPRGTHRAQRPHPRAHPPLSLRAHLRSGPRRRFATGAFQHDALDGAGMRHDVVTANWPRTNTWDGFASS